MARMCMICAHAERERIELEIANASSMREVGLRWGVPRKTAQRHKQVHMEQVQIARLRHGFPYDIEISIDELTRKEGQAAVLGLKRLGLELQEIAKRCDSIGDLSNSIRARAEQKAVYREQARLAAMYPGLKPTTNNNLIVADFTVFAEQLDQVLRPFPDARAAVSQMFLQPAALALEAA